jgi:hypothetical protein
MDPWANEAALAAYANAAIQGKTAERERDIKRRDELALTIQRIAVNGWKFADAKEVADIIVSLERRIARLEGESYARTL